MFETVREVEEEIFTEEKNIVLKRGPTDSILLGNV